MLVAGELSFAAELIDRVPSGKWKEEMTQLMEAELDHQRAGLNSQSKEQGDELAEYLQLPVNLKAVTFCDSEGSIRDAMNHFFPAWKSRKLRANPEDTPESSSSDRCSTRVVGLDVEWKPVTSRSTIDAPVASIIQIASDSRVFIVDLLKLHVSLGSCCLLGRGGFSCCNLQDYDFLFDVFLHQLFTSGELLKLGFNFEADLRGNCFIVVRGMTS